MPLRLPTLACVLALACGGAQAQTAPKVTHLQDPAAARFMWVGNSFFYYNNGMPALVQYLVRGAPAADQRPYQATMVTMGGSGFDWHDLESYFRPGHVGAYTLYQPPKVLTPVGFPSS